MPAGRPSEYRPEYCNEIIELMATGLSLTAAGADLGFAKQTLHNWADEHPEFMDAIKIGQAKRQAALEKRLYASEGAQVTAHIFALKNTGTGDWREKHDYEHTGKDGAPLIPPAADATTFARQVAFLLAKGAVEKT